MPKKLLTFSLLLLVAVACLTAKEKAVSLKKLSQSDVGNPAMAGSSKLIEKSLQITAGGADVWGVKDEFRFAWLEKTGDFDLAGRVESLSSPHLYTKAGIMAREDLSANSRHIFFQVFPNNKPRNKNNGGYEFQYRAAKAGEMKAIYPAKAEGIPEFPVNYPNTWIRLQRVGNLFTGYWSADGKIWKVYTTYSLDLPEKIMLGMAITSHNTKEVATALFSDVTIK